MYFLGEDGGKPPLPGLASHGLLTLPVMESVGSSGGTLGPS